MGISIALMSDRFVFNRFTFTSQYWAFNDGEFVANFRDDVDVGADFEDVFLDDDPLYVVLV